MKEYEATLSELDYEQLPAALRRKYFSSLERLRLAHDGAYPICPSRNPREPQRPLTSSNSSSFSTKRPSRRPSTTLDDCVLSSAPSTRNKLRKPSRVVSITSQQVADFASLPPVLQRKQFSREEQVLLASRINHVIFDAADEAIYKHHGQKSRPSTAYQDLSSAPTELFYSEDGLEEDMELSQGDIESLRWLDEEEDLDLSLYDYHAAITETTLRTHGPTRKPSHRRGLMISNVPFSRRSSSTNSSGGQAAWPLPAPSVAQSSSSVVAVAAPVVPKTHRPHQSIATSGHRKNRTSTSSLDPLAAHYQDPTARMKLRVYLASPQKFDEAIEFGFPSMKDSSKMLPPRPTTSPRSTESGIQHFPVDDTPSLSDGDDHEAETLDSPRTPEMSAFSTAFPKSKESSLDRTTFRPKIVRDFTEPYVHALTSNREMTLHMTLTRPDLRSPEDTSSSRVINSRPLEQVPLQFTDDPASFWDSLPDEESKMKRILKKFMFRS